MATKKNSKDTAEAKSVEPAPEPALYECDLVLDRISKYTVRYLVNDSEGIPTDFNNMEFDRSYFPNDDDFNLSFMDLALPKGAESVKDRRKQDTFNSYRKLRLSIVKA